MPKCELCNDTGWYGDNGAGIKGNSEIIQCECGVKILPPEKKVSELTISELFELIIKAVRECKSRESEFELLKRQLYGSDKFRGEK